MNFPVREGCGWVVLLGLGALPAGLVVGTNWDSPYFCLRDFESKNGTVPNLYAVEGIWGDFQALSRVNEAKSTGTVDKSVSIEVLEPYRLSSQIT